MQIDKNKELNEKNLEITKTYQDKPETIIELIEFSAKFHKYSAQNQLLINAQNRGATFVASYRDWKNKFNHSVKKGEKGIAVRVPVSVKTFIRNNENIKISQANSQEKLKIANGEIPVISQTFYKLGYVFDIAQTNCPPSDYPKFFDMGYQSIDHKEMFEVFNSVSEKMGFTVETKDLSSISLKGYCEPENKYIALNDKLKDTEKLSTLLHEFSHGILHTTSAVQTRGTSAIEFEAESLNIMLHIKTNLEVPESSKRYITNHYKEINFEKENLDKMFSKLNKALNFCDTEIKKIVDERDLLQFKETRQEHHQDMKQENSNFENFLKDI